MRSSLPHPVRGLAARAIAPLGAAVGRRGHALVQEQHSLRRLATAIASETVLEEVFAVAAREAAAVAGARVAVVRRIDADGTAETVGSWPAVARFGMASGETASVPVDAGGLRWGTLIALEPGSGGLAPDAERRLARVAELVGLAVVNGESRRRLAEQASLDALTGLANHRVFHERLQEEASRAERHGRPLSLAVIDLDRFKDINDRHGHQTGDRVLREVAARLATHAREEDLLARVGGEEFAWLMPETDDLAAFAAAERARGSVSGLQVPGVPGLTISVGVCDMGSAGDPAELFRFADEALYLAKSHGRDLCFRYSPEVAATAGALRSGAVRGAALTALETVARAVDARDPNKRNHSERVSAMAERVALAAGWAPDDARALREAALLHDVGKIGEIDDVLLRPGPLTEAERARIATHVELSVRMAAGALSDRQLAWIRGHHERWDGQGYPDGLAAREIPEGASFIAVADAWDAMTSPRAYSPVLEREEALEEIARNAGVQFAPAAADALCRVVTALEGVRSAERAGAE